MKQNENTDGSWDEIIDSSGNVVKGNLSELWKYRDLIILFVRRDFVQFYKQTILGPFWYLLQPLFTTLVFSVIFGKLASLPTDGMPPFLFYLAGITSWNYFSDCVNKTSKTFINNVNIFGKVYFPRLTVPISIVISSLIAFGIQLLLFLGFLVYFICVGNSVFPSWYLLFLPVLIFIMALLGLGIGIIVSSLTTKYRDLQYVVTFGIQLYMYATPVIYSLSSIPSSYRIYLLLNPMTSLIESFRFMFTGIGEFNLFHLAYSFVFSIVIFFIGLFLFNRVEKTFMDSI